MMNRLNQNRPLLCQTFIGREWELQELKALLDNTTAGRAQICLLSGEAGLGKTRLCHAFMEICRNQQAPVLFGEASPRASMLPFGLFLDLFHRSYAMFPEDSPPFQQALHATFSFLLPFSPEPDALFAALSFPADTSITTPARHLPVLFHQVLRGLHTLTRVCQRPLIVVLEDLHWADETSLDLLAFLAHRLGMRTPLAETSLPLLILGTYRTEVLPDTPALQRLVAHLSAQRQADHLHLAPLNRSEHRQCVRKILNQAVSEEFAHFLYGWDEGNPFFTEELLSAMRANGQLPAQSEGWLLPHGAKPHLPSSLTTAILERFHRLSNEDQEVLTYAAVIGRVFDFPLLMLLCQIDAYELAQVLRRAIKLQLISVLESETLRANHEQERYQFRHTLTRETIYEQMLLPERRLRHRTVAETIEEYALTTGSEVSAPVIRIDNATQLLLEHYHLAGLDERARPYALQAAQRASQIGAFREERLYLEIAQASLPQESPQRLQLLERIGIASVGILDCPAALHWLSLARKGYLRSKHSSQALEILTVMHLAAWYMAHESQHQILAELEEEIEVTFAHEDLTRRDVHLLMASSYLAMYQCLCGRYQRILQLVERNNALFEALTDPQKLISLQINRIAYCWARVNQHARFVDESIAELRHILTIAYQHGLPQILMFASSSLQLLLVSWGRIDEAESMTKEACVYEEEALSDLVRASYPVGWLYFFSGEKWEQGIKIISTHMEHQRQKNIFGSLSVDGIVLSHLLIARNDFQKARECLAQAHSRSGCMNENLHLLWMSWAFAKLYSAQGKQDLAQEWYERTLARWHMTEDTLYILPILLDGITFSAQMGNLQQAKGWLTHLEQVTGATENPVGKAASLEARGIIASLARTGRSAFTASGEEKCRAQGAPTPARGSGGVSAPGHTRL